MSTEVSLAPLSEAIPLLTMAFTHDIDMRIVPGRSLGDFTLGDSLWNVLERMRARKLEYEGTTLKWDREVSVSVVFSSSWLDVS